MAPFHFELAVVEVGNVNLSLLMREQRAGKLQRTSENQPHI